MGTAKLFLSMLLSFLLLTAVPALCKTWIIAWMLHCHIIDHEDNGMMTMVMAE
jgi:hypothetical protein